MCSGAVLYYHAVFKYLTRLYCMVKPHVVGRNYEYFDDNSAEHLR